MFALSSSSSSEEEDAKRSLSSESSSDEASPEDDDDDDDDDDALMPAFQSLVQKRMVETFCPGKGKTVGNFTLFFGGTKGKEKARRAEHVLARKISRLLSFLGRVGGIVKEKYYELLLFLSDARPQYFFFVFVDINARRRRGIDGRRFDKSFRFPQRAIDGFSRLAFRGTIRVGDCTRREEVVFVWHKRRGTRFAF